MRPRLARLQGEVAALRRPANDEAQELVRLLGDRGAREAEQLKEIPEGQQAKAKIRTALGREDALGKGETAEAKQQRLYRHHMEGRLDALRTELQSEPAALREHYTVLTLRIEAVGIVSLAPESR